MMKHEKFIDKHWGNHWEKEQFRDFSCPVKKYKIRQFRRILEYYHPKNVLEVGCGNSTWLEKLRELNPYLKVCGIDISKKAVEISNKKGINASLQDCRNTNFKENTFDFIFSIGVVEHYEKDQTLKAIAEHLRILKRGGILWLEVPSNRSLCGIQAWITRKLHPKPRARILVENGLRYSYKDLINFVQKTGYFTKIEVLGSGPIFFYYDILPNWVEYLIPDFLRKYFGGNSGLLITKIY